METSTTLVDRLVIVSFRRGFVLTLLAIGALIAVTAPLVLGTYWVSVLIQLMIFGLFALSLDLLVGHTGLLPLGHAAFFSVAAYGTALLQVDAGQHPVVAVLGGLVAAIVLAAIFGVAVRSSGVYFILLTMALGLIVWGTAYRWTSVTGGETGIRNIMPPDIFGLELSSLHNYYYIAFLVVVLSVLGYLTVVKSPFGLVLNGIRESESRMRSLGYNVGAYKYVAFVMSGTLAGIAGVLYVYWNKFMSPAATELIRSAEAVLMLILGGSGTIAGPFLGAGIILGIRNQLSAYTDRYMLVMGVIFILVALFARRGILGRFQDWRHRRKRLIDERERQDGDRALEGSGAR